MAVNISADRRRELLVRAMARSFCDNIKSRRAPQEIPSQITKELQDMNERRKFERYLFQFGYFQRSDGKWQKIPNK